MPKPNMHVLIVDDEPDSLDLMQLLFNYQGMTSTGVPSAEAALSVLNEIAPDLVIVDLALPKMDGWGLLHRLQETPSVKDVPKIAITAFHTPILAAKAVAAGFDAFSPKPIDAQSVVQDVMEISNAK